MKYFLFFLFFSPYLLMAQSDFEKAETLFKASKFEQSKSYFEKVVKQNPSDLKSIEYLGDIQCNFKKWEKAIPYYERLKKLKPTEADFFYKYGGALGMQAKECNKFKALSMMDDVKAAFEKAIFLNPKHIGARWALIEVYIQLPGIVGGSERKAIKYSDELLKISPIDGYLSRGHIEEYFDRFTKAEIQYKKAIEVGNSKTSYQKLADLYQNKMKQPEKAKQTMAIFNQKNKF